VSQSVMTANYHTQQVIHPGLFPTIDYSRKDQFFVIDQKDAFIPCSSQLHAQGMGMSHSINTLNGFSFSKKNLSFLNVSWRDSEKIAPHSNPLLSELDKTYVMEDRKKIPPFIEENHLDAILHQSCAPLNSAFGNNSLKKLSLICDDEGIETLFCLIMFSGSVQDAQKSLSSFDQNWWLSQSFRFAGKLEFDFELV
jgi:hypothetical protein